MKQIVFTQLEDGEYWQTSPDFRKRGKPLISLGNPITGYSFFQNGKRKKIDFVNYTILKDFLSINNLTEFDLIPKINGSFCILPIEYPQFHPLEINGKNPDIVMKELNKIANLMFNFDCNLIVIYHYGKPIEYISSTVRIEGKECEQAWSNVVLFGYTTDSFDKEDKNKDWDIVYENTIGERNKG